MNENDMDRYFWRTGQRWSGDSRPMPEPFPKTTAPGRVIVVVCLSFIRDAGRAFSDEIGFIRNMLTPAG
jgi:hypothetical protein